MANIQDGSATFHVVDLRTEQKKKEMVDLVYPVGIVVAIANDNKPDFMNYGTWEKVAPDRVLWGAGKHTPGAIIAAGLPNITGSVISGTPNYDSTVSCSGAFSLNTKSNFNIPGGSGIIVNGFDFDASRSNSIYGNSDTVQPDAYVVTYWQRTE